jgi:hypothetical protein
MGEHYGIKVAFQIEPYESRTPEQLIADVQYLYENYGEYPAFYRTAKGSLWIPDDRQKGLFFLRNTPASYQEQSENSKYWRGAIDAIHELPDGGIVLTDSPYPLWISLSHFDGIYSYNSLDQDFDYALNIRMDAWYVPSVTPGFSMERIGHPEGLYLPRDNGETYKAQWHSAFYTITKPDMVTITSFNGWHEGTQIEPATPGIETDEGLVYEDYESLEPEAYLFITSEYINIFNSDEWPPVYRVQIHMTTTSDWTVFQVVEGGRMVRRKQHFVSEEATRGGFHIDQGFLYQEIERAQAGGVVELITDILITDLDPEGVLVFEIERGHEGWTEVQLMNFITDEPILIGTYLWAGVNDGPRNAIEFEVPASLIIEPPS